MTAHVQAFVWTWVFISFRQKHISEIAGSQYRYIFKFSINCQVVFQRDCTTLHFNRAVLIILGVLYLIFSFFQLTCSVVYNSLQPHGPQHGRPPCPSPNPGVYPNSCPLSRWCHPNISSSVIPFSSCLQSFPESGFFHMSQLFASGGQAIGVSASTSVLPMNTQDWSPLGWTGWISLQSKGLPRVFSSTTVQTHQFFSTQLSL